MLEFFQVNFVQNGKEPEDNMEEQMDVLEKLHALLLSSEVDSTQSSVAQSKDLRNIGKPVY